MILRLVAALMFITCLGQSAESAQSTGPRIRFLSPHGDQSVSNYPITVKVEVSNFKLLPPIEFWGRQAANDEGHIHYMLDDSPIYATSATTITLNSPGKPLPPGRHILRAELVRCNHSSLQNPVFAEVTINCKPSLIKQTAAKANISAAQVNQIDAQVKEIQAQLRQVSGH